MGWKASGDPTVRKQRDKWVVRIDGIDTETGKHRPRQVGTYASQRSAQTAARSVSVEAGLATRDTVGWLGAPLRRLALGRPAARVPMPRAVAKPPKQKEVDAWTDDQVARFLPASADHRWAVAFRLGVLYGLRRYEALALKWNDLDASKGTLRIDQGLVAVSKGVVWSEPRTRAPGGCHPLDRVLSESIGDRDGAFVDPASMPSLSQPIVRRARFAAVRPWTRTSVAAADHTRSPPCPSTTSARHPAA